MQEDTPDFVKVTEVSGEEVSREQILRMYSRYRFAANFCGEKNVLEVACGSGQGLGLLAKDAKKLIGGDYSKALLSFAHNHYGNRIPLLRLDGHILPFVGGCFDRVILYEAIYYLRNSKTFIEECRRVLRPGGILLLCTANKDLPDFNPSPHSWRYFSAPEFSQLLVPRGFEVDFYGDLRVDYDSPRERVLSLVKKTVVRFHLMPKTMAGKKLFKRMIFGKLVPMPPELNGEGGSTPPLEPIRGDRADTCHKVLFAVARKRAG